MKPQRNLTCLLSLVSMLSASTPLVAQAGDGPKVRAAGGVAGEVIDGEARALVQASLRLESDTAGGEPWHSNDSYVEAMIVKAKLGVNGDGIEYADVEITPVAVAMPTYEWNYATSPEALPQVVGHRRLMVNVVPIAISREQAYKKESGVSAHAVRIDYETAGKFDRAGRLDYFLQTAVNLVGAYYAALGTDHPPKTDSLTGSSLAKVRFLAGLAIEPNRKTSFRIAVGGTADAVVGQVRSAEDIGFISEQELFARLSFSRQTVLDPISDQVPVEAFVSAGFKHLTMQGSEWQEVTDLRDRLPVTFMIGATIGNY